MSLYWDGVTGMAQAVGYTGSRAGDSLLAEVWVQMLSKHRPKAVQL